MKKAFRLLLAALLIFFGRPATAQQTDKPGSFLWEVEAGTKKLYLFGTIHFSSTNFFPLAKVIDQAFMTSESVIFETDLDDGNSPAALSKTLAAAKYPQGDVLTNHISPQVYSNLQVYLTEAGGKGSELDSVKPFVVFYSLMNHATKALGFDMLQSVDRHLWDRAKREKKRLIPLESFDETLGLLTGLSDIEQQNLLEQTLQQVAKTNHIIRDAALAWVSGRSDQVDKLLIEEIRRNPDLAKKLLIDRNKKWISLIEAEIKKGKIVFVAVGVGHLLGKDSLVDLLSKRGFKVRQI